MSGTPQKMLEHLLETRLGGQAGPNDPFLDDFLLTHIVFMPVPLLIDELAANYHADADIDLRQASDEDQEYFLTSKRRVVQFIQRWVLAVRHAVFDDPLAVEFIEVRIADGLIISIIAMVMIDDEIEMTPRRSHPGLPKRTRKEIAGAKMRDSS